MKKIIILLAFNTISTYAMMHKDEPLEAREVMQMLEVMQGENYTVSRESSTWDRIKKNVCIAIYHPPKHYSDLTLAQYQYVQQQNITLKGVSLNQPDLPPRAFQMREMFLKDQRLQIEADMNAKNQGVMRCCQQAGDICSLGGFGFTFCSGCIINAGYWKAALCLPTSCWLCAALSLCYQLY